VLATVFTSNGSYVSPQAYVAGLTPAMWVGAAVLAVGALIALVFPFNTRDGAAVQVADQAGAGEAAVALPA